MPKLKLFEIELNVRDNNFIDFPNKPPFLKVVENNSKINGNRAEILVWLTVGNFESFSAHSVFIRLNIRVKKIGDTYFPEDGVHQQPAGNKLIIETRSEAFQGPSSGAGMLFNSGAFRIRKTSFPSRGVIGGTFDGESRITFHFQDATITRPENSPLSISIPPTNTAQQGFYLDLRTPDIAGSEPQLVFLPAAFSATVRTLLGSPLFPIPKEFSRDKLASEKVPLSLNSPLNNPRIVFNPTRPGQALFLHADLYNSEQPYSAEHNPLIAPIELENYKLEVLFSPLNADMPKISRLTVQPTMVDGKASFLLRNFTYANTQNVPVEFYVKNNLNLHLRVGSSNRPATLLVAPEYNNNIRQIQTELRSVNDIHGFVKNSKYKLMKSGLLFCNRRREIPSPGPNAPSNTAWIDSRIVSEITAPWFYFDPSAQGKNTFFHEKPGETYTRGNVASDLKEINTFDFQGESFALPALSSHLFSRNADYKMLEQEQLNYINQRYVANLKDAVEIIQHETLLKEGPTANPNIDLTEVFKRKELPEIVNLNNSVKVQEVKIAPYEVTRDYGPVKVKFTVDPNINRDYFVLRKNSAGSFNFEILKYDLRMDTRGDFDVTAPPKGEGTNLPHGILKLSDRFTLEEILTKEGFNPANIAGILDADVKKSAWLGLILFEVPVIPGSAGNTSQILKSVVPSEGINLKYIAITPEKTFSTGTDKLNYSVNARIIWNATKEQPDGNPASEQEGETFFALKKLDVFWRDSQLNSFDAEALVNFKSFFGIFKTSGLKIIGSYDKSKDTIRFLGQLNNPLKLLPEGGIAGPIRQVSVKSAEILYSQGRVAVSIDGQIEFQEFSVFKIAEGSLADFDSLQIKLPESAGDGSPKWLGIEYPNLRLKLNLPPLRLGFLSLKLNGLGINWKRGDFKTDSLKGVTGHNSADLNGIFMFLQLRLELMKMPELATGIIDKLTFDFFTGLGTTDNRLNFDLSRLRIWLKAVSFENLDINLMRFLRIKIEEVAFEQREVELPGGGMENVTWLKFIGVRVIILDNVIVNDLTIFIFSASDNRRGFVAYYASENNPNSESKIISIHWILIGNNIALQPNLAKQIIQVDHPGSTKALQTRIKSAVDTNEIAKQPSDSKQGNWIFAASFTLLGDLLDGKFLFQDKAYYGICIGGGIFERWFGYRFAISVLYIKANDPNQDAFVISVAVPFVTLPAFSFMGGVITIEIVMNGGFTLDVGFPHLLPSGGRQWNRAFGAIMFPFQGSGGFYIQKRSFSNGNQNGLVLAAGYAVQGGLGASFGGAIFRVWVTVGFYFILEGRILLCDRELRGLQLVGANGLLVRGAGELNWWIISIRVEITLSAEARVTFIWGNTIPEGEILPSHCLEKKQDALLILDFTLYASVEAEACIGGGWFKICKGISVTIPLHFGYQIKLN